MSWARPFLVRLVAASRWYDNLTGGLRFLVFMLVTLPGIIMISFPSATAPVLFFAGVLYIGTMLVLRLLGMHLKI